MQQSDIINKGLNQTNNLRVALKGRSATFYVNDKQVATLKGFPPGGGSMLGLRCFVEERGQLLGILELRRAKIAVTNGSAALETKGDSTMKFPLITTAIVVLLAIGPAAIRADDDAEIFSDDFSTLDQAWGLAGEQLRVQNNKLVLHPQDNGYYTTLYQGNLFNDADIRVQATQTDGAPVEPAAIAFWGNDYANYYVAEIQANGMFAIYRLTSGHWLAASPWQKSDAIKQGLGQTE